ncbi:MAG TPA: alkaline phosphatase family protein, partial [Candidatus Nitrosotalea sp.]|nr:alkaline phosphatase family protein [Candidatus Nitrosotalea sp.]
MILRVGKLLAAGIAASLLASCAASPVTSAGSALVPIESSLGPETGSSKYISHVVIVVQENRSFDDLFATFPGAYGATQGLMKTSSG